jgi:hypothetical protein
MRERLWASLGGAVIGLICGIFAIALPPMPHDWSSFLLVPLVGSLVFGFVCFLGGPKLATALLWFLLQWDIVSWISKFSRNGPEYR